MALVRQTCTLLAMVVCRLDVQPLLPVALTPVDVPELLSRCPAVVAGTGAAAGSGRVLAGGASGVLASPARSSPGNAFQSLGLAFQVAAVDAECRARGTRYARGAA
jgi:hypothetical protein